MDASAASYRQLAVSGQRTVPRGIYGLDLNLVDCAGIEEHNRPLARRACSRPQAMRSSTECVPLALSSCAPSRDGISFTRGFTVTSAAAFVPGAAATLCSATVGAFLEVLTTAERLIVCTVPTQVE